MSEAGDDIQVDAPAPEVEATPDTAPKGKLSVEEALQVRGTHYHTVAVSYLDSL